MKGSLIAFDTIRGRGCAARMVDGRLEDLLIDPPDDRIRPGAVYRAKVGKPMKGQGGAFLETPDGRLFLRQAKGIPEGETLIVQTGTFAEPGKATPVSPRVLFKSRYAIVTPGAEGRNVARSIRDEERRIELREIMSDVDLPDGFGLVIRSAAEDSSDDDIVEDLVATVELARRVMSEPQSGAPEKLLEGLEASELAWSNWPRPDMQDIEPGSFERHGIDAAIAALSNPREAVSTEADFFVEPTRALVAVDINTGSNSSPAAGLRANLAVAGALPRALRLRGLGGQIVLDCAPMPKRDRKQFEQALTRAFRADPVETTLIGWTPLGHFELQRKRERLPISEIFG